MTKEQVVGLGVRLFAIALAIYVIRDALNYIPFVVSNIEQDFGWILVGSIMVVFLLIAVYLWFFPLTVSRKLLPSDEARSDEKPFASPDLETTAYSLLGLWVLITAIPDMFYWISIWLVAVMKNINLEGTNLDQIGASLSTVIEIVIGFWLLFGARGLKGLIRKMRYAGS